MSLRIDFNRLLGCPNAKTTSCPSTSLLDNSAPRPSTVPIRGRDQLPVRAPGAFEQQARAFPVRASTFLSKCKTQPLAERPPFPSKHCPPAVPCPSASLSKQFLSTPCPGRQKAGRNPKYKPSIASLQDPTSAVGVQYTHHALYCKADKHALKMQKSKPLCTGGFGGGKP